MGDEQAEPAGADQEQHRVERRCEPEEGGKQQIARRGEHQHRRRERSRSSTPCGRGAARRRRMSVVGRPVGDREDARIGDGDRHRPDIARRG